MLTKLLFLLLSFVSSHEIQAAPLKRLRVQGEEAQSGSAALSVGRVVYWKVQKGQSVSVSNGAVLRVVDQGEHIKVTALKLGHAVLRSGSRSLEVAVIPEKSYRTYAMLTDALKNKRGLVVDVASGKIRVTGRLLRFDDWQEIAEAQKAIPAGDFEFVAEFDDQMKRIAKEKLRYIAKSHGFPDLDFRFEGRPSVSVPSEPKELVSLVTQEFAPYGIRVDSNFQNVHLAPLVRVGIVVAEFKKSMNSKIGIEWPGEASAKVLPAPFTFNETIAAAHLREANGITKLLASPTLLCRSGKEAQFLAGGEFPIKVTSLTEASVQWKRYGVLLKIKPIADASGRMSIAIETEVSTIDTARLVDGIPGMFTNRIETHFDLVGKRTIALSGLIQNQEGQHKKGLAGLSSLPILGPLFSSREYLDDQTELVIFVTPEVVSPETGDPS